MQAFAAYLFVIRGLLRRFLFLSSYLSLSIVISTAEYVVLRKFGIVSSVYAHVYFYTDAVLSVALFLTICELSVRLFAVKQRGKTVLVLWGAGALVFTACLGVFVPWSAASRMSVAANVSQGMFFLCCLAIGLLWARMLRHDPENRMAVRILTVLSIDAGLFLMMYGVSEIVMPSSGIYQVRVIAGAWLPLGCGFAAVSER
jgi:hypothetical protein